MSFVPGFRKNMRVMQISRILGQPFDPKAGIAGLLSRKSGIRYDLTVEPGLPGMPIHDDPDSTDWLPDFRGAPPDPYTPMGNNYLLNGGAAPGLAYSEFTTTPEAIGRWLSRAS